MNSFLPKFFALVATLLIAKVAFAATNNVTLAWDANTEQGVSYMVYWGTASGIYEQHSDAQHNTSQTIQNLTVGDEYYFAVTAYNQDGVESAYSDEISTVVPPGPDPTPTPSPTATPTPTPTPPPGPPQYLLNLSTRVRVRGGDNVMIGGFIIEGDVNKDVVFRALGPSLGSLGLKHPLPDPKLEVYDSTGALIYQNDNWTTLPPDTVPAGLEPPDPAEAVIVASLAPGGYTAVLRSADGAEGNALCELYDLVPGDSIFRNISTRGEVGSADDVMIGGFIIGGSAPAKIMVRAIGPSLTAFGVTGVLPDPVLELHDKDGSLIYENNNWRAVQAQPIIDSTIAPSNESESAIIATLAPGAYTAIVRDAGTAQGVALVEVYMLSQ